MRHDVKTFLYDIQQACDSLQEFTSGKTFADYQKDELLRAGVERKLMIVGEAVRVKTKDLMTLESDISQARQINGFRNVLVHGYFAIEEETIWGIVKNDIPVLADEVAQLLE